MTSTYKKNLYFYIFLWQNATKTGYITVIINLHFYGYNIYVVFLF